MFSNSQRERIVEAKEESISRCMRRFGFTYEIPKSADSYRPASLTELRYGVTDPSGAAIYGYRPKGSEGAVKPPKQSPQPENFSQVLKGVDGQSHERTGKTVPQGGCIGEAKRALRDTEKDGGGGDAEISNKINAASWQSSFEDSRVRKAFQKWSKCMAEKGYKYTDPMQANNDPLWREGRRATTKEKKVAEGDATCKKLHNVVSTWYTTDKSYQQKMIAGNIKELSPVKKKIEMQLRLASKILAD